MKRQIKETTIHGKRGPRRVITYGYNTQINGLSVVRTIERDYKEFTVIHDRSGLSIAVYFTAAAKAVRFANKYLKGFDFMQGEDTLLMDGKLGESVHDAKTREGL